MASDCTVAGLAKIPFTMKKDIQQVVVEMVSVVAIPPNQPTEDSLWNIYLTNEGNEAMENVIVASKGYGMVDGRDKTTTVLRYFFQRIEPGARVLVEPMQPALFAIYNEYWVSFNLGEDMLDRRYIFPASSISLEALQGVEIGILAQ